MKTKRIENSVFTPNITTYTYPGILSTELLEKPLIDIPALSTLYTIRPGIRSNEQLHILNPISTILEKGTNTCIPTYSQGGSITGKTLTTGLFEVNRSWCKKEFQGLLSTYNVYGDDPSYVGNGLSGYELGGKLRAKVLNSLLGTLQQDIFKVAFLGQTAYSGSSVYSTIDGLWTNYLDGFGSYCIKPVYNALPNGATSVLNANQARDTFRLMWGQAPTTLRSRMASALGGVKLFVTGSMWDNYLNSLEDNCCVEGSWRLLQDGTKTLYYRGIELVPLWILDYTLENEANPYTGLLRHFAILTSPSNNVFGVESTSDLNNLELCYDCKDKTTYIQGEMRFGVNYIHCDETVIAY